MTAIYYRDCEVRSPSGQFTLEAKSPHNGTIPHRDGRFPSEDDFPFRYRSHQREFRYRLIENMEGGEPLGSTSDACDAAVVWERFQEKGEESPGELVVSDDGWSIICTYGFDPEMIAVAPDGRDALRVNITADDGLVGDGDQRRKAPGPFWPLTRTLETTAGRIWSRHSWRFFFRHHDRPFFSWRSWWGQRLVLDLEGPIAYTVVEHLPGDLASAVIDAEGVAVETLLASLSPHMDEVRNLLTRRTETEEDERADRHPLTDRIAQATAALHLAGVHRLRGCVPYLREWESLDWPSAWTDSAAMPWFWQLEMQYFRPIVQLALKRLGEEPRGFPTYGFAWGWTASRKRFPMPSHLTDRRARAARLWRWMSAKAVLRRLGSPDFVHQRSGVVEDWEYDFRDGMGWTTLRLTWCGGIIGGVIVSNKEIAPYWLDSQEREEEFIHLW